MKRKILFFVVSLFLVFSAISESKKIVRKEYSLTVFYPEKVQSGDPIFLRMIFECKNKAVIKKVGLDGEEKGSVSIHKIGEEGRVEQKCAAKSEFYKISRNATKKSIHSEILTGAPLSTWVKSGKYVAKINYEAFGISDTSIEVPILVVDKEFVSETIPLNASNTAIKTNTSSERMNQINRLNKILDTKNFDAVYETRNFVAPNPATRRTSFFGDRRVFAYNDGKNSTSLHYGIDYGVPTGSEVRACGNGKVVLAEDRISTGWSICIEHLPGLYSLYYHMSELKVQLGEIVKQGDLIGLSGATGLATGPHLHWEIRLNMEAVSPDFFISDFTYEEESKKKK